LAFSGYWQRAENHTLQKAQTFISEIKSAFINKKQNALKK